MRFEFIHVEKATYPVEMLCRILEVSRSGYYRWRDAQPSLRSKEDEMLKLEIKAGSLLDFSIPQLDSGFVDAGATEFTTEVSGFGNDRRFVKFRASFGVAQGATTPPAIDTIVIPYVKVDP